MTVTEYLNTNGAWGFSSWASTIADSGVSSPSIKYTSTNGGTATLTNWNGYALYNNLCSGPLQSFGGTSGGGDFSVTNDGTLMAPQTGVFTCRNANTNFKAVEVNRALQPLCRNLADTTHTTILTALAATHRTMLDSCISLSGAKITPPAVPRVVVCGDSWSLKGWTSQESAWDYQLARALQARLMGSTLDGTVKNTNRAVSGAAFVQPKNSAVTSISYQVVQNAINNATEAPTWLILQGGGNDLKQTGAGCSLTDYIQNLRGLLNFIQDAYDITQVKVCLTTVQWVHYVNFFAQIQSGYSTPGQLIPNGVDVLVASTKAVLGLQQEFPWLRIANLFEAFRARPELCMPNGNFDCGLHPNDSGQQVVANTILQALVTDYL